MQLIQTNSLNKSLYIIMELANNIKKKIMQLHEKKVNPNKSINQLTKSFLKSSKSEIFLIKKHKKSTSVEKHKIQLSKNDQRVTIYTDKMGFIVDYSILIYGLKCECFIFQSTGKKVSKTLKLESIQTRQNPIKKKIKLQITLNKQNIAIIKSGVQHIFALPCIEQRHNFLKVVLLQNWQIEQFIVSNKKTKITNGQMLANTSNINVDQIYPLTNITEADELRKNKLIKSDSKINISWGNTQKQSFQQNGWDKNSDILSFSTGRISLQMSRSMILQPSKQIPRDAFLRKSFNQCDQTRDSQEDQLIEEKHFEKKHGKKQDQARISQNLSINLSQWNHHEPHWQAKKQGHTDRSFRPQGCHINIVEPRCRVAATQRFFK